MSKKQITQKLAQECQAVTCYSDSGKRGKATRKVVVWGTNGKETLRMCKTCADKVEGKK